jgi:hypothetical protein
MVSFCSSVANDELGKNKNIKHLISQSKIEVENFKKALKNAETSIQDVGNMDAK